MLRAVGFGDADFDKPIVGVANGHSTMNPCNAGIQPLVDRAMAALREAGAMPQVFGVPTVTDGIGMGTEGMKYSLVSREVIADAIETAVNGQCMDGVLVVGGCDKNMPGGDDGDGAHERPGHLRLRGHDQARPLEGPGAHDRLAVRGGRRVHRGQDVEGGLRRHRAQRLPERRRLRRHVHGEHDVLVVRGARHEPARQLADGRRPTPRRPTPPRAVGARAGRGDRSSDLKPRDIITRKSIENAIALVMATGGSTNAVLHYLAIASAAEVAWTIDDFERIRQRVPVLCDLKPSGRYVAVDFNAPAACRRC